MNFNPNKMIMVGLFSMGVTIEYEDSFEIRISVPEFCEPLKDRVDKSQSDSDYLNSQVKKQFDTINYLNSRKLLSRVRKGERVTEEQYNQNFRNYCRSL